MPDALYLEFYELKVQLINDVIRASQIENVLEEGSEKELNEIDERLDLIHKRINEMTKLSNN